MKIIQIIQFIFLFNFFLFLFTSLGIWSYHVNEAITVAEDSDITDINAKPEPKSALDTLLDLGGGIGGLIVAALAGTLAHWLAGVSGIQATGIGLVLGFCSGMFFQTYGVLIRIASGWGQFAYIMNGIYLLMGFVFVISIVYLFIQLGFGGGRSYD